MKKILFALALLFFTLITNAQTLEGEWKFEKMKFSDILIYFDDTNEDKENFIRAYLKTLEMGMASKDEKDRWKKEINENKALMYNNGRDQYKGKIKFKGDFKGADDIYDGYGDGKLSFNYLNDDNKIEIVEAEIEIEDNNLKVYDKQLFNNSLYDILLKGKKLSLTDVDEIIIIYYEKKS